MTSRYLLLFYVNKVTKLRIIKRKVPSIFSRTSQAIGSENLQARLTSGYIAKEVVLQPIQLYSIALYCITLKCIPYILMCCIVL